MPVNDEIQKLLLLLNFIVLKKISKIKAVLESRIGLGTS